MIEQENLAFGDKEPFDFYLSAFLGAGRTVDYRLRHEQPAYKAWRASWDASLIPAEDRLIKFMIDDRNVEVHESGSARNVKNVGTPVVGNRYSDKSGTLEILAPPETPPAMIYSPAYSFTVDGTERKAVDVCSEYLRLLDRMVAEFKAAYP
jgi:hypothetical protein